MQLVNTTLILWKSELVWPHPILAIVGFIILINSKYLNYRDSLIVILNYKVWFDMQSAINCAYSFGFSMNRIITNLVFFSMFFNNIKITYLYVLRETEKKTIKI